MSLRVLHLVESLDQSPGTVMVCLPGLFSVLDARQVHSRVTTEALDSMGADVVHIHGWGYRTSLALARRARRTGIPYWISPYGSLHMDGARGGIWRRLRRDFAGRRHLRCAAGLIALNDLEGSELRRAGAHDTVHVLPLGITVAAYVCAEAKRESRRALVLGPLDPRGGCVALLKALAEMGASADGWSVVLASRADDPWRASLGAALRRKGAADRVSLSVADDLVHQQALIASAEVIMAPNLQVAPPVSIMQAAASGRACLATTCVVPGGLVSAIRVCSPRRDELREAVGAIFGLSDSARAAMGRTARNAVHASLDWSVLADRYFELYKAAARAST